MNLEKFTDRARGFLQSAQTVASRMNHQQIAPIHVLKALPSLRGGVRNKRVSSAVSMEVGKLGLQYRMKAA